MQHEEKFKPGFIGYHKATLKRLVSQGPSMSGNMIIVTTEDGKKETYMPEEIWSEDEYEAKYGNHFA